MKTRTKIILPIVTFVITFSILIFTSVCKALLLGIPTELKIEEKEKLEKILDEKFPVRNSLIRSLPYETIDAKLDIFAKSAILIDAQNGNILFQKNADEEIPPASMTKLVEMSVVFDAINENKISLDDVVPLPPESWSANLPQDASRMFLAQGQHITLNELLLGLAIASGNDASIAIANYVASSMEDFVFRMNEKVKSLGLTKTHFVESSGYSEKNITSAREFVAFSRYYILNYDFALERYHSQKILSYPQERNSPGAATIVQHNTNKLIDILEGCDGIKTGYIDESGYNLALTAKRNGMRFISVTMGGPGKNSAEGIFARNHDGGILMEFAFANFYNFKPKENFFPIPVNVVGSRTKCINAILCEDESFAVPFIKGSSPQSCAELVKVKVDLPKIIFCGIKAGDKIGEATYSLDENVLRKIPLVADRDALQGNSLTTTWAKIIFAIIEKIQHTQ